MNDPSGPEPREPEVKETLSGRKQRFSLSRLEILFGGLLLVGLIYIGYVLFFQEGSDFSPALEKRMKKLEALMGEQTEKIDREIKALQALQAQLDARLRALENPSRTVTQPPVPPPASAVSNTPPKPASPTAAAGPVEKKTPSASTERKKIVHKVKKGETLKGIAAKYKVSTKDLLAWNKSIKQKSIRPGDTLTILSR